MASRSLNKVLLIGNLTRDPEMRYTSNGNPVCVFGIATNRTWKDSTSGDLKEETEFVNIVSWGKLAEICHNLLAKGMLVYVEGELRTRNYQNDKGDTVYKTEVHASDMQLLNDKGKTGAGKVSKEEVEEVKEDNGNPVDEEMVDKNSGGKKDEEAEKDVFNDDDLVF